MEFMEGFRLSQERADRWQKREFNRDMERFNYWNYLRDKPISYFLYPLPVNIAWLFRSKSRIWIDNFMYVFGLEGFE